MIKQMMTGIFCLTSLSPLAMAEDTRTSYLARDHLIYLGIFDQTAESSLLAQRGDLPPASVDFDGVGVADDYTSGMLEYRYRWTDKWNVSASYFRFSNGGTAAVSEEFNFDGVEFELGAEVKSSLRVDTYILAASYALHKTDSSEIAVGGGIHALDVSTTLEATGFVNGEPVSDSEQAGSSILAPLPNVRASAFHAFNDKWAVLATGGWLSVTVDEYEGNYRYFHLRGQYQVSNAFGLTLGYQLVDIDVEESLSDGRNRFDFGFSGLTAGITYEF